MEKDGINIYYDAEADFLEIVLGEPLECYYRKVQPDTYARIDEKTGEIGGYAIFNAKHSDSPLKTVSLKIPKSLLRRKRRA